MSSTLPSTLFSSKKSFAQMLPSMLNHPSHVEQISQHLTADLELFRQYGILFLEQISDQTIDIKPIIVLSCVNRYFIQCLADNEKSLKDVVDEARLIVFSYCLKIRNTRQDLDDIEIYHVLYSVLGQCAPSSTLSWQKELDMSSQAKEKKMLQDCDDLIEHYIRNPNDYPAEILVDDQDPGKTIRCLLFNLLFESKMKPLQLKNDKHFAFSDAWARLLKHASNSPAHVEFNVVVQLTEKSLWDIQAEHLHLPSLQETAINAHPVVFSNQQEYETTLRECLKSLQVAHTMYISTIVYSMIQLIQHARVSYNDDDQFQGRINQMSRAIWFELYQSLLTDAAFETLPCEASPIIARLFKVAACYIQFRLALNIPYTEFPMSIWDHYYLQRSIFLKSTGITDNTLLIEKVVFTSAGALL
ncbi:Pyr_redox_2 domain-containing protein [Mucor velutinosus]|uniref:Pyr_redox_2 domain-containing protein n=1 Tax=Mucor velutinosus TaxID=708070 RepID=A0AAN7HT62_9FUNG|nr:Pyr_redox_2 domain-containing protein [Mucor velutinosus]